MDVNHLRQSSLFFFFCFLVLRLVICVDGLLYIYCEGHMEMCCFRRVSLEGLMRSFLALLDANIVLWGPRPVSGQTVGEME